MKLLVTGAWGNASEQLNNLKTLGHDVVFMQNEKDELPCSPIDIEGVICNGLFLYHDIDEFSSLKYVQLTSAGFDRVPMDKINSRGIKIFNARGVYSIPMAEYAVWGVLSLYKKAKTFNANQSQNKWDKQREIFELYGKTVLIVGCGNVGLECAKRFKAFGTNLIGVDLEERQDDVIGKVYKINDIDKALNIADVVVLTLPLTELTKGLFDRTRFSQMKDGSILVNIARGQVVEENAMLEALDAKLYGAVLDVFNEEPLSNSSPLWQKENVIVTPHNSFVGEGNGERLTSRIIQNLKVGML
ncbi:MAG: hydroxyacid dehydrogenase [Clostridia bacterium]|nr:hydroxyacid dehydrogenase [Clostridia bacterium]